MTTNNALAEAMKAAAQVALEAKATNQIYGVREGAPPIAPWPSLPAKIIFLDFDGVMNSEQSNLRLGTRYRFAKSSVAALNEILRQSNAHIVISSSWREHWTLRENAEFLEQDGVLPGRVVGKTPNLNRERGFDIDAWLGSAPYPVESFVILDDTDNMAMHRSRLIHVASDTGLELSHVALALELLAKPWQRKT